MAGRITETLLVAEVFSLFRQYSVFNVHISWLKIEKSVDFGSWVISFQNRWTTGFVSKTFSYHIPLFGLPPIHAQCVIRYRIIRPSHLHPKAKEGTHIMLKRGCRLSTFLLFHLGRKIAHFSVWTRELRRLFHCCAARIVLCEFCCAVVRTVGSEKRFNTALPTGIEIHYPLRLYEQISMKDVTIGTSMTLTRKMPLQRRDS